MSAAVHHLPGTVVDALAWAADRKPKAVVILAQDAEQSWEATWSLMTMDQLTYAHRLLGLAIDRRILGEVPTR